MKENAFAKYIKKREEEKKIYSLTLSSMLRDYCDTNPLLDIEQKNYTKSDEEYLTAEELYNAYLEIEDYVIRELPEYPEKMILEWAQEQLGERYKAFYNVYLRRHKKKPDMSTEEYLKYFESQMNKLKDKLEFGWYNKGFTSTDKKSVKESMEKTVLYLRSIGKWKLAEEVFSYIHEPLEKPKLPKSTTQKMIKLFTPIMALRCKITKKEAKKLLQDTISQIF